MKMEIYKKGQTQYRAKYQDFVDALRFTFEYMAFFPLPNRVLKRIKEIERSTNNG